MKRRSAKVASPPKKKAKLEEDLSIYLDLNRTYYKHPISCREANKFNNKTRAKPIDTLNYLGLPKNTSVKIPEVFIHWFRSDLRVADNTSFYKTLNEFETLRKKFSSGRFITVFVINEHDWRAHLDSGWKLSFMLKGLASLHQKLAKMRIPLHILQFHPKAALLSNSDEFAKWFKSECKHLAKGSDGINVSVNAEYETDELYRDIKIMKHKDSSFNFQVHHDTCVLEPCILKTGKGSIYTLFTPWYKKWAVEVEGIIKKSEKSYLNITDEEKEYNTDFKATELSYKLPDEFTCYIPTSIEYDLEASETAAANLLTTFLKQRVGSYDEKDILKTEGSSHLSCYLSVGIISSRKVVYEAFKKSTQGGLISSDIKKNTCLQEFVREVAWRDFYKNAICNWPYLTMDLPFKFEMNDLRWKRDEGLFKKWCEGTTGVPIVDAIMRKLLCTGYINNRARMIVASFLSKNLLLDWRWGERWFRRHLRDYDLSSNIGGWGFCSSTGIDAQPYFRIFNMELQSKKYDPNGEFIKEWVPELKSCTNVHILEKIQGYHTPVVDLKDSRNEALEAYREVV